MRNKMKWFVAKSLVSLKMSASLFSWIHVCITYLPPHCPCTRCNRGHASKCVFIMEMRDCSVQLARAATGIVKKNTISKIDE